MIRWTTFSLAMLLTVGAVNLVAKKHVTLVIDGRIQAIATDSSNVRQLLVGEGIELTSNIRVEPPPTTEISNGMTVVVSPAPAVPEAPKNSGKNDQGVGVWVVDGAADYRAVSEGQLAETSVSAGRVDDTSAVFARVVVCGKVHDVLTNASTVGELLSAMGVQSDANDLVFPSLKTPLHARSWVRYDQVDVVVRLRWGQIPFKVLTTYSNHVATGSVQVTRRGVPGVGLLSYRVVRIDGEVYERRVTTRRVRRAPVDETRVEGPAPSWGGTLRATHQDGGLASWYDPPWSGLSAASPWLPFGTHVRVTDLATGRSVIVVINDRGPFAPGKIIDLSPEAFQVLSPLGRGVLHVRISW